jgi:hypothetical protein
MHLMGRGRTARETYPSVAPTFGVPDEIIRYSFELTSAMAGTTQNPTANQLGGTPQDAGAPTNFAALLFTVPGGRLDLGDLVVINGGASGDPIDFQYTIATIASPSPVPDGSLKVGVIDPTVSGILSSQIDFTDVLIPAGGGILTLQVIIPANFAVDPESTVVVSLSVGVIWDPNTIRDPPA